MIVSVYQKALRIGTAATGTPSSSFSSFVAANCLRDSHCSFHVSADVDLDSGKTVSLMSNDAQRVFELFMFLNEAIMGIPQLAGVLKSFHSILM
jgi:hypothetical protein